MRVRTLGSFYDLGIYSAEFIYVVDTSASMKGERIKNLEVNLSSSTADLKEPARFNIIMFGGEINIASDQLITATSGTYIADQISNLKLSLATRTFDAIYMAGQFDEIDTIYFLSDGAPVHGFFWQMVHDHSRVQIFAPLSTHRNVHGPVQCGHRKRKSNEVVCLRKLRPMWWAK